MNKNLKNLTSFQLRLKYDFDQIRKLKQSYLAIAIPNDKNPNKVVANLKLEEGPFQNLILHMNIEIPKNYPYFPPQIFIDIAQGFKDIHHSSLIQSYSKDNLKNNNNLNMLRLNFNILELNQWLTSYTLLTVLTQIKLALEKPIDNNNYNLTEGDIQQLIIQSKTFTAQIERNNNQISIHSYENPYPAFFNAENQQENQILEQAEQYSTYLTCSILKHNFKNSNDQFILGFPINFDENNKPVLKVLYKEPISYQAYSDLKLYFDNNELEQCLRSGQGHAINSWFPLYLSEQHFQNGLKQLKYFISSMHFSNAFSEQTLLKKFAKDQFINVFPILLQQLLVKKNDEQALQAFFQVLRLFLKLINYYPTIQNQIDDEIGEILDINENQCKKQKQFNKFKFFNISELILMLGLSSNSFDDYEIWNLIIDEFLARHIAEIIKDNSKNNHQFCIINFTKEQFFNAVKEDLGDIIYYTCIVKYCLQNKQQFCTEIDKNGGIILNIQDIFNNIEDKINYQISDFNKLYEFFEISEEQELQRENNLKQQKQSNQQQAQLINKKEEKGAAEEEEEENVICYAIKTAFQYEYLNIAQQPFFNKNIDLKILTKDKTLEESQKNLIQHLEIYETIFFEELDKQNISLKKCQAAADTIIDFFILLVEINKNIKEVEFPEDLDDFQKLLYQCAISNNHSIKKSDIQDFILDFLAEQMTEQIEKKPDLIQTINNKLLSSSHFFKMIKENLLEYSKYLLFIQVFVNQKINKKVIKDYQQLESQNNSCTVSQKAIEEYQELFIQLQYSNNTFEELFEFLEITNYQKKFGKSIIETLFNHIIEQEFLDPQILIKQQQNNFVKNFEVIVDKSNINENENSEQIIDKQSQLSQLTYQEKEKIYQFFINQNIQYLFDLTKELADLDCITEVIVQQYCCEIQFIFQDIFKQYPFLPKFIVDETNNLLADDEYTLRNKNNLKSIGLFVILFYITKYVEKSNHSQINDKEFNIQYKKKLMVILKEFCSRQVKSAIEKNFIEDKEYQDELSRKNKHQELATNFYNQMAKQNKMIALNLIMAQNFIVREYIENLKTVEEMLNFAMQEFQEQCDFIRKQMNGFETFFQCIGIYISMPETFINLFLKEVFELSIRQGYSQEIIQTYQQYMPKAKNNEIFDVLLNNNETNDDLYLQVNNKKNIIFNQ